jgi:3-oxoacyl-[acyl-carrier protein] reductase
VKLAGKTALITGASRGIGAAIAREFAKEGANLVISGRTVDQTGVLKELEALGVGVEVVAGDIGDDAHVRALVQRCRTRFGGLNILVNNAGVLVSGKLGMLRLDEARRMFEINVLATINLTQYAVRVFPRGAGGSVVNLASIAGTHGIDGISAYSASKAAVVGFTRAAAKELAPQKIRVNAIAPGFIDTDMARQVSPEWFEKRVESVRLGRIGTPEDVARCAVFLASDDAAYVTGQVIGVDGAMTV